MVAGGGGYQVGELRYWLKGGSVHAVDAEVGGGNGDGEQSKNA